MVSIRDLQFEDGGEATPAMHLTSYDDIVACEQSLEAELDTIRTELETEQEEPDNDALVKLIGRSRLLDIYHASLKYQISESQCVDFALEELDKRMETCF